MRGLAALVLAGTLVTGLSNRQDAGKEYLLVGASHTVAYSRYFPCPAEVLAKSGHQTSWMRENLASALIVSGAKHVVILGGINDNLSDVPVEETKKNLSEMPEIARHFGAKVTYLMPPPFKGYSSPTSSWSEERHSRLDEVKHWLKSGYRTHDTAGFMSSDGETLRPEYRGRHLPDGYLHPSPQAYEMMAAYIAAGVGCTGHPQ